MHGKPEGAGWLAALIVPGSRAAPGHGRRTPRDWIVDVVCVLLGFGSGLIGLGEGAASARFGEPRSWLLLSCCAAGALALLLRRRWPAGLTATLIVASTAIPTVGGAAGLALFSVAVHRRPAVSVALGAVAMLSCVVQFWLYPVGSGAYGYLLAVALTALACAALVGWGVVVRTRRQLMISLTERAVRAEQEQALRVEQGQRQERERIAREMHDALGHRLSLLSVHAGALEFRPDMPAGELSRAAGVIRSVARDCVDDLREIVGVLRSQHTIDGPRRGVAELDKLQPPTGELRWRDPRPAHAWTGIREATKPGPACAQTDAVGGYLAGSSEDCLYLDVTTPAANGRQRPVMVWLHGGAWASGTGSDYDGRWLAGTGDAVVVTVNYRLGVFGFLGHPGLPGSGTYALADQQAALRWVRSNARVFGGDPGNVTLIGQSAGGASVCAHLSSPTAAGLFHRAVIHSGSCLRNWPRDTIVPGTDEIGYWASREDLQTRGRAAAKAVGCETGDQLRCLRAAPADKLLELNGRFGRAAYHTRLLPVDPRKALTLGIYHRIPVLQGNTRDEHRYFGPLFELDGEMDAAGYRSRLQRSFGAETAARIEAVYPAGRYASVLEAWTQNGEVAVPSPAGDFTVHLTPTSAEHLRRWVSSLGALVCGRTLFDVAEGWQGRHTLNVPVVVVTHRVPTDWVDARPDAPFSFVTDGIEAAIARAQELAGDRVVAVAGGTVARQCLELGLLDEVAVDLVPVVMGEGNRPFFGELSSEVLLGNPTVCVQGDQVTHLVFPVPR